MKINHIFALCLIITVLNVPYSGHAAFITATNSGNWSDTNIWDSRTVPGADDGIDVEVPVNVTVDTNAVTQFIAGSGTVTMGAGSTLNVLTDASIDSNITLDTSANGNTVMYSGNAYFAKRQDYYHLALVGNGNLFTGNIGNGPTPMTIAGTFTLDGTASVQQGASITVNSDLLIGTNSIYDASVAPMTVKGNTLVNGTLTDGAGGTTNLDDAFNNITIAPGGTWKLSDVVEWSVNGSLTNQGTIVGKSYGSITFGGDGIIAGDPITVPTITVNGTYNIATTITLITNTPTLNGTLVFDIANPGELILQFYPDNPLTLYYSGNLEVVNSGASPASGTTYKLFDAASYDGSFSSVQLPPLPEGLSWVDNLKTDGSISVTGTVANTAPTITNFHYEPTTHEFAVTWTSEAGAIYTIQSSTNLSSGFTSLTTDIPSGGATTTATVTMPDSNLGFLRILKQ
jgi:hypothetical protein